VCVSAVLTADAALDVAKVSFYLPSLSRRRGTSAGSLTAPLEPLSADGSPRRPPPCEAKGEGRGGEMMLKKTHKLACSCCFAFASCASRTVFKTALLSAIPFQTTAGGILLASSSAPRMDEATVGTVMAVGDEVEGIAVGDMVLFTKYGTSDIEVPDGDVCFVAQKSILAKLS